MFAERVYNKMPKYKYKSNYVNTYTKYEYSTQVTDSTKKTHCSHESESADSRHRLLNLKLVNRSMHKSALEYLDLQEYIDNTDSKNRTKCAAISQVDQQDLDKISKFVYNSDHNDELAQGDKLNKDEQESSFNYIIDSNSLDNVDSSTKLTTDKVDVMDYNNNNVDEWNYNEQEHASKQKVADQNERIDIVKSAYLSKPEAKKPGFLVVDQLKSNEKYTYMPEYAFTQQTQIRQQHNKLESENINKVEYVYFDKSESDEAKEYDDKNKETAFDKLEKMDYLQVPMYEMEKTVVKDKCKLKLNFNYLYYCISFLCMFCSSHQHTMWFEKEIN